MPAVISGNQVVEVIYDADGEAAGFRVDGAEYTYVKNLQGDVVRILDSNKTAVVNYSYDPWGVPTVSGDTDLAAMNPCSYRGYYYDWESGYYYLQSRYYDPIVGRFLNADDAGMLVNVAGSLEGNLFSYCENNAPNKNDPTGYLGKHFYNKVGFVASVIDIVIILFGFHQSKATFAAIKQFLRNNRNELVKRIYRRLVSYIAKLTVSTVSAAVDVALSLFGTSIGDLIAKALDYIDPWFGFTRNNGYIFN